MFGTLLVQETRASVLGPASVLMMKWTVGTDLTSLVTQHPTES